MRLRFTYVMAALAALSFVGSAINAPAVASSAQQARLRGARFFVATDGDDDNPGSAAAPWRTIQHAVDEARPGDRIIVRPGAYLGARVAVSGKQGGRITLKAAAGGTVTLTGPGPAARHGSTLEIENFDGVVSHWSIKGFEIVGGSFSGVDIRVARSIRVIGNRVHGAGRTGIFTAFADDVLIARNESSDNGEHGVYASNSGDRPTVKNNWLHDNASAGIHMNGDLSQGGDGVISGAVIVGNVIDGNGRLGASGINLDGVDRARVFNNLIFDEHASGISLYQIDGGICSSNARVYHNTVVVSADGRWAMNMPDPGCRNNDVRNNIFFTAHSFRGAVNIASPAPPGFRSNHNVLLSRFSTDGGDSVIGIAAWRALGYGTRSVVAEPAQVFVDSDADDYRLRAGSPARDAGATLKPVKRDIEGTRRPLCGGTDPGAYEAACERRRR